MTSEWGTRRPKRPPPPDGVRVKKLGVTWWGQRWIGSLERFSREYLSRLGRGRSYARGGRVHDLKIVPGKVTALVTGSETMPYEVSISMEAFSARTWNAAIAAMAKEARFAAELLAGRMPQDIDTVFRGAKCSLFPRKSHDLETDCSCPDWASPCKHVAAVHYVLGEAFDKDPFLLFELRGRSREQVLHALSRLRSSGRETQAETSADVATTVAVRSGDASAYEQLPTALPALRFSFDSPSAPAAILRTAGAPAAWSLEESPVDFFAALYASAAQLARELALAKIEATDPAPWPRAADPHRERSGAEGE
jgi:uncharacterized Zn finger protein